MEAVHRAKLLLLLADFSGVKSSLPAIVARYKVKAFPAKTSPQCRNTFSLSPGVSEFRFHCMMSAFDREQMMRD